MLSWEHYELFLWKAFWGILLLAFTLGTVFSGYALFKHVMANGEIEYCFIEYEAPSGYPPIYRLRGFRKWASDSYLGAYPTLEEAAKAAELARCKISRR